MGKPFNLWEVEVAFKYLRNRRKNGGIAVIAILSFIGIFASVSSMVVVASTMRGLQARQMDIFFTFKNHIVVSEAANTNAGTRQQNLGAIRTIAGVKQAAPYAEGQALVQAEGATTATLVLGVEHTADVTRDGLRRTLLAGNLDLFSDDSACSNCVVIGSGMAQTLGIQAGQSISIISSLASSRSYVVSAIIESGDQKIDSAYIFMPMAQAQDLLGLGDKWTGVGVILSDPFALVRHLAAIKKVMGKEAKVTSWQETDHAIWSALNIERISMQIILYFVIMIASSNIVAGLTMLVKNKSKDIGILRSIGCTKNSITRIFVICGVLIGGTATIGGVVLGAVLVTYLEPIQKILDVFFHVRFMGYENNLKGFTYLPAQLDGVELAVIFFSSVLISTACTLFPALAASNLDPVRAVTDS